MEKFKTDALVIIAMTEEIVALEASAFFPLDREQSVEAFSYREFSYPDSNGIERKGILVSPGEIGPQSRDVAVLFSERFRPRIVINVGISGRIKDAQVGDIVVPSHVNIVDVRGAVQDNENGTYDFMAGGRPASVSQRATGIIKSSLFRTENNMLSLEEFAKREGRKLSKREAASIANWTKQGTLSSRPNVVMGGFASSNMVIKSTSFKEKVLRAVDRNNIALDMESGTIADSLRALSEPPDFFSVRAISDPANDQKEDFDAIGNGMFRRWAMHNATTTLKTLLQSPQLYGDHKLATELLNRGVGGYDYLETYPGQRLTEGSVEDFDKRFANLFRNENKSEPSRTRFSSFLQEIQDLSPGARVLVQGHGGAGKSAMLRKAWLSLKHGQAQAVFFNARNAIADAATSGMRAALLRRINRDAVYWDSDERRLYLFVDELYGLPDEQAMLRELEQILPGRIPTFILGFGVDHYNRAYLADHEIPEPYIYDISFSARFDLKTVGLDDTDTALLLIEGIICTGHPHSRKTAHEVFLSLKSLGFLYINHFVVSLYLNNFDKISFSKTARYTGFVLRAMEGLYADLHGANEARSGFRNVCVEALRVHCRETAGIPVTGNRSRYAEIYETTFSHFPKVVQTSLIAQAVVHILANYSRAASIFDDVEIPREVFLSLVFANDVNSSIKDLMSADGVEHQVLKTAHSILKDVEPMGLSYALYLAGRTVTPTGRRIAQEMFEKARGLLLSHDPSDEETDSKYVRLARRSWYISAAMMDDPVATSRYISLVLSDPKEDVLNRSFHLEYFGDHKGTAITVQLELEDRGGPWRHTRSILRRRIDQTISAGVAKNYERICILTYFCLVRFRLERGSLDTSSSEQDYLDKILGANLQLGLELSSFLGGLREQLERQRFDHVDAIVELFRLKSLPRTGWVKRGMGDVGVETVASHVFGAMLLAELLMAHAQPGISLEERASVLRLLLSHDLGEAYIGDYDPFDGEAKVKEPGAIRRIGALSLFKSLTTAAEVVPLFEEFENGSTTSSRLARDFDKLDAVFQAYVYAPSFQTAGDRTKFLNYHLDRIQSLPLKEIAKEVIRRAELEIIVT